MARLDSRVALVTGAGQGIGRGTALALASEGASVALVGRTAASLESAAAEIDARSNSARTFVCDVSDRGQVFATVNEIVETFGRLDIVVNSAQSYAELRRLQDVVPDDVAVCWSSGPMGTLNVMQAAFPALQANGGSIVNFGSNTGVEGSPHFGAYAMAKEAVRGLTKVAAREWGRFQIRVNTVCPFGGSPNAEAFNAARPEAAAAILKATPLGRMGDCELDIGRAIAALVSDDFSYLTGATLMLDGGLCMLRG